VRFNLPCTSTLKYSTSCSLKFKIECLLLANTYSTQLIYFSHILTYLLSALIDQSNPPYLLISIFLLNKIAVSSQWMYPIFSMKMPLFNIIITTQTSKCNAIIFNFEEINEFLQAYFNIFVDDQLEESCFSTLIYFFDRYFESFSNLFLVQSF